MSNTHRRPLGQVSNWHPATNEITPASRQSTFVPHGLTLRHTILGGTITGVSASAGTVTYTCRNNFTAGDRVSIINVLPVAYNLTNVQVATATETNFTVTNAATGTYVSGGNAFTTFTIPTGVTWVYVVLVAGGGSAQFSCGGGGGGVAWGWTTAQNTCIIGSGATGFGTNGGYTRYGHIIAGGGGSGAVTGGILGGGTGGNNTPGAAGGTNYWGIPGGTGALGAIPAGPGAGGGGGTNNNGGKDGGNGISGGGAGFSGAVIGGNGGSGIVGGGGAAGSTTGGVGGNGIGIDGTIYTGGNSGGTGGGGGAGIAGNGNSNGAGGLGGGGGGAGGASNAGGNGILYIWY